MTSKKDQEGRVETAQPKNDQSYQDNFPQAKAANATREAYQQTADQQRIAAERAKNMELAAKREEERKSKVNADPVPTDSQRDGERDDQQDPDPQGDRPLTPDVDSDPHRKA